MSTLITLADITWYHIFCLAGAIICTLIGNYYLGPHTAKTNQLSAQLRFGRRMSEEKRNEIKAQLWAHEWSGWPILLAFLAAFAFMLGLLPNW